MIFILRGICRPFQLWIRDKQAGFTGISLWITLCTVWIVMRIPLIYAVYAGNCIYTVYFKNHAKKASKWRKEHGIRQKISE